MYTLRIILLIGALILAAASAVVSRLSDPDTVGKGILIGLLWTLSAAGVMIAVLSWIAQLVWRAL